MSHARTVLLCLSCLVVAGIAQAIPPHGEGLPSSLSPSRLTTEECLVCHNESGVVGMAEVNPRDGLVVNSDYLDHSVHGGFECIYCHEGIADIPHEAELPEVDPFVCSSCHEDAYDQYQRSAHGLALEEGDTHAPGCTDCHGHMDDHDIHAVSDPQSGAHRLSLPATCGNCHNDERFAREHAIEVPDAYQSYVTGVHGHGLLRAGLLISASCNNCHGSHYILAGEDPDSPISPLNVLDTCSACHGALVAQFNESIHGQLLQQGRDDVPTCTTCHDTHGIAPAAEEGFIAQAVEECGTCHAEMLDTYSGTYHGKIHSMGFTGIAACSSCHTAHQILPEEDPASTVHADNLVATCATCHPGATASFATYIVHADPTDWERFPLLFAVYFGMMTLLTLTIIGGTVHTGVWYWRLHRERRERGQSYGHGSFEGGSDRPEYVRFNAFNRMLHILVMASFLILVATGLPVRFAGVPWAGRMAQLFGGFRGASFLHKTGAIIIVVYVTLHLGYLIYLRFKKGEKGLVFGSESLLPNYRDFVELKANVKWFFGRGPRPEFGRWTYWEKFDYFADAWGVLIIGGTGLLLWFPVFFTQWLPGWTINVAVILHGFEALLALSFIFTVHFFAAHLRPGKFPMDPVFLTGRIPLEELHDERPREYRQLVERGELESSLVGPSSEITRHYAKVVGYAALTIGLMLLAIVALTGLWILFT